MAFYNQSLDLSTFSFYVGSDPKTAFNVFASGYRRAAETLTTSLLRRRRYSDYEAYPIVFLYRHAFELSLKHAIYKAVEYTSYCAPQDFDDRLHNDHNLHRLSLIVERSLNRVFPNDSFLMKLIPRLRDTSRDFDFIDPSSMVYRYPVDTKGRAAKGGQSVNLRSFAIHMSALLEDIDTLNFGLNNMTDIAQDALAEVFRSSHDYAS